MSKPGPRILGFDLECTHLDANMGRILCACYKWFGEKKTHTLSIGDNPRFGKDPYATLDDKSVAARMSAEIGKADMIVTWFGTYFDLKFLNSRLLYHGLPPLPPVPHVDGWWISKHKLKLNSNRLASAQQFLNLPTSKTSLDWNVWALASVGHRPSLRYIETHCLKDVEVLEEAYEKLKPLTNTHPNVAVMVGVDGGCPICGGKHLQRRGFRVTRTTKQRRFQCQDCGGWCLAPLTQGIPR